MDRQEGDSRTEADALGTGGDGGVEQLGSGRGAALDLEVPLREPDGGEAQLVGERNLIQCLAVALLRALLRANGELKKTLNSIRGSFRGPIGVSAAPRRYQVAHAGTNRQRAPSAPVSQALIVTACAVGVSLLLADSGRWRRRHLGLTYEREMHPEADSLLPDQGARLLRGQPA